MIIIIIINIYVTLFFKVKQKYYGYVCALTVWLTITSTKGCLKIIGLLLSVNYIYFKYHNNMISVYLPCKKVLMLIRCG